MERDSFSTALRWLKAGRKVQRRAAWPRWKRLELVTTWPHICFLQGGGLVPWNPTQEDILAEDWEVLPVT